ncbi:MAG: hypothetical protein MJZ77_00260 [Bacteroidales bacterium]|nr:hypothetical protein [Bacteroidales bacterium]
MNREELNERRIHVRRLIDEVNNAHDRDLMNEKNRFYDQLREVNVHHSLKVEGINREYRARMIDLKAERDRLSHVVPDDVQEGGAE